MTNTSYLNMKIKEKGFKKSYLAHELGISRQSFSSKLNNKRDFNYREIVKLSALLSIPPSKRDIFFCADVGNLAQ